MVNVSEQEALSEITVTAAPFHRVIVTRQTLVDTTVGGFVTVILKIPYPLYPILSDDGVPEAVHVGIEIGPNVTEGDVHVSSSDTLV